MVSFILHLMTFGALVCIFILLLRSRVRERHFQKKANTASEWVQWHKKVEADLHAQIRDEQSFRQDMLTWLNLESQVYKDSTSVQKAMKQRFEERTALLAELQKRRREM